MTDFEPRVAAFLKPTPKSIKLSKAARALEDLYDKAHAAFLGKERSTCMDINKEIMDKFLNYDVTNDRFWKMNLMARSHLLLAHFQYNYKNNLTLDLLNVCNEAYMAEQSLKGDGDHWTTHLKDVKELCGEMNYRIVVEKPSDRFLFDDKTCKWTLRMTAEWLQATDHWREEHFMADLKRKMKSILLLHPDSRKPIFKAKLKVFMQPKIEIDHLSDFAQDQESCYRAAYSSFHAHMQRTASYNSLERAKFCSLIWPPTTPAERLWRIDFMARCSLLLALFYHSPGLRTELEHWATAAQEEKQSLGETDYLVQKSMDDVHHLCTEMKGRIDAEEPRERFQKVEGLPNDPVRRWTIRLGAAWLHETANWAEPRERKDVGGNADGAGTKVKREVWGLFGPVEP
ncbi:MAG: hypothetical protein Q9212_002879 [Teloschistes hypoglaucus]